MIQKAKSFFIRDFQIEISYRFNFILQAVSGFIFLLIFFYISEAVLFRDQEIINKYGESYFLFTSLGIISINFIMIALFSSSSAIRDGQTLGYLESLISYRLGIIEIFYFNILFPLTKGFFIALIHFMLLILVLNQDISLINLIDIFILLFLTILPFVGIGMISASFVLVFKMGNPINILASALTTFFSGIFFPTQSLPDWAVSFSKIIPLTHGLEAIRLRVSGATYAEIYPEVLILFLHSLLFIFLGSIVLRFAFNYAKKSGTLGAY